MTGELTLLNVVSKSTGDFKSLRWEEINDAVTDEQGVLILFDSEMEPHYLLVDEDFLKE